MEGQSARARITSPDSRTRSAAVPALSCTIFPSTKHHSLSDPAGSSPQLLYTTCHDTAPCAISISTRSSQKTTTTTRIPMVGSAVANGPCRNEKRGTDPGHASRTAENLSPEDNDAMIEAYSQTLDVLGPTSTNGFTEREIKDVLWDAYFDVDTAVTQLVEEKSRREAKAERERQKQGKSQARSARCCPSSDLDSLELPCRRTRVGTLPSCCAEATRRAGDAS